MVGSQPFYQKKVRLLRTNIQQTSSENQVRAAKDPSQAFKPVIKYSFHRKFMTAN
jgi:hypothetical protein